ncbi:cysteine hydrolase family protein [Microbacterium sp. 69-10]|uniref:cysteine hydrolase family protein n=1 Tax=Microbacterium sp. 69-10 TaxID=1895783 RepID=UPI0025D8D828|nr:cysteine hydrolase family protein [Microbacterium sp. 69-10]
MQSSSKTGLLSQAQLSQGHKPGEVAVLLLIDLQKAADLIQADSVDAKPSWGGRNNTAAETNTALLLEHWRERGWPVWHVRHDSSEPASHYRPGQYGNEFKPEVMPNAGEPVIRKTTNSAFIGTDLHERLTECGYRSLVIVGVATNNSVEATVRMAGNLGYDTFLVSDATFTWGRIDWNGAVRTADDVHAMSLANMDGEYCTVVTTAEMLSA